MNEEFTSYSRKSIRKIKFNEAKVNSNSPSKKKITKISEITSKEKLLEFLKKELDEKLSKLFSAQPSLVGYRQDIESILNDLHLSKENLFKIVLEFLSKSIRKESEVRIIVSYLFSMQGLTNLLLKTINPDINSQDKNLLNNLFALSRILAYEKFPKDYILIHFGEKGSKAYINLSGEVAVLIKKQYKIKLSEDEYLNYLANLIKNNEYELANIVMNENFKTLPIEVIDDINEQENEKKVIPSVSVKEITQFTAFHTENEENQTSHSIYKKKTFKENTMLRIPKKSSQKLNEVIIPKIHRSKLRLNQENEKLKALSAPVKILASNLLKKYNLKFIGKRLLNRCSLEEYINRINVIKSYDFNENKYIIEKENEKDEENEEKKEDKKEENNTDKNEEKNGDKNKNKDKDKDKNGEEEEKTEERKKIDNIENKAYFSIYLYIHIVNLSKGSLFGEMALNHKNSLRNATIITLDECHCGVLNKKSYNNCLKNGAEKNLYDILYFIVELPIFKGIQPGVFLKKYYTSLSLNTINKNYKIITQGEKPENITLLKSGQYTIYTYNSLYNITNLMIYYMKINRKTKTNDELFNKIILSIKTTNKLLIENEKFRVYYFSKNNFKVGEISCPDIIGYNEYIDKEGKYAFSIESKALKGDFFILKNTFYEEMMRKNEIVRNNQQELYSSKIDLLLERLYNMRKIVINTFFEYKTKEEIGRTVCKEIDESIVNQAKFKRFKKLYSTNYKIPHSQKESIVNNAINVNNINNYNNEINFLDINKKTILNQKNSKNKIPLLNLKTICKTEKNSNNNTNNLNIFEKKNEKQNLFNYTRYNKSYKVNNIIRNGNNKNVLSTIPNKNYNKTINYFYKNLTIFKNDNDNNNNIINNKNHKNTIDNNSIKAFATERKNNINGICLNKLIWEDIKDIKEQISYPINNNSNEVSSKEKILFKNAQKKRKKNWSIQKFYEFIKNREKDKNDNEKSLSLNLLTEDYKTLPVFKSNRIKRNKNIEANANKINYSDRFNNALHKSDIDKLNYDIERNNYYKKIFRKRLKFLFKKKK